MGQPRSFTDCTKSLGSDASIDAVANCAGHGTITVIDTSWGVPGLGADGTVALGGMAIAAAMATLLAWRKLQPVKPARR